MNKWDQRMLRLALHISSWSKDPSKQVGAVLADDNNRIIGIGYNGFPRGISDDIPRLYDSPTKRLLIVHAETNAILNASRSVADCTLYTTLFPCNECSKIIIQSGIKRVVAIVDNNKNISARYNFEISENMFAEANIHYEYKELLI